MAGVYTPAEPAQFFFYVESTFGNDPVDDSSDWATAVAGASGHAIRVTGFDPAPIVQTSVDDPDLRRRTTEAFAPIQGIKSGMEVSFTTKWYGNEVATADASQVTQTALGRMFQLALGGTNRGDTTTVAAAPTNDTSYDLTLATNSAAGCIIFAEDDDDLNRLWPQRIETLAGSSITTHVDLPWAAAIAAGDQVHAAQTGYIDPVALNKGGSGYNTISVLVERNGTVWVATGCKLRLDSISFEINGVPTLNWTLLVGRVKPPGDGAPAAPSATTHEGGAGLAWGIDSYCHFQDFGTTTQNTIPVYSMSVTVGTEVRALPALTSSSQNLDAIEGYQGGLVDSFIEFATQFDTDWQDDWDTQQEKVFTFWQVAAAGKPVCVHAPRCVLAQPPAVVNGNGGNKQMQIRLRCLEDSVVTGTALGRSPILLAQG